jgi:hypothetical protein
VVAAAPVLPAAEAPDALFDVGVLEEPQATKVVIAATNAMAVVATRVWCIVDS